MKHFSMIGCPTTIDLGASIRTTFMIARTGFTNSKLRYFRNPLNKHQTLFSGALTGTGLVYFFRIRLSQWSSLYFPSKISSRVDNKAESLCQGAGIETVRSSSEFSRKFEFRNDLSSRSLSNATKSTALR